jgi:hypothetical protein
VQLEAPADPEYLPAGQSAQDEAPAAEDVVNDPDAHAAHALAPAAEYLPAAHVSVHGEARPVTALYLPEAQSVQYALAAALAYFPAAQLVQLEAPAAEYRPAAHELEHAVVLAVALL